jgi:protein-S-isoprenylcysteine O-methyltransferase Ste14
VSVVDALLLLAWLTIAIDNLRLAGRTAAEHVVVQAWSPPLGLRGAFVIAMIAGTAWLDVSTGGARPVPALVTAIGLGLAVGGVALHLHARRVLGRWWSAPITVRADQDVITAGPYGHVRHPLYLAILMLALGTATAHPSVSTVCVAIGLTIGVAIKIPMEERALRATLGERYARYADRVPALLPRLGR